MNTTYVSNVVKGPNGHSIATSHLDATAVVSDPRLHKNIKKLSTLGGKEWLYEDMVALSKLQPNKNYLSGRLALLAEGGGKTRTIAIGDYWSQNMLLGVHDKLMSVLRRMETDGTWDQNNQFERILNESPGHSTYSFDLSSATDRFPVRLQVILLSHVFSPELARAWRGVMTQRSFQYQHHTVV
jgi:hypothetical protein